MHVGPASSIFRSQPDSWHKWHVQFLFRGLITTMSAAGLRGRSVTMVMLADTLPLSMIDGVCK